MDPFVHLHVASGYSRGYGASPPEQLVQCAAAAQMDILALTDRDGLYGAVKFATACGRHGITPILGVDLAVEPTRLLGAPSPHDDNRHQAMPTATLPARASGTGGTDTARAGMSRRTTPAHGGAFRLSLAQRSPRITILAGSRAGWAALCRLVSGTHLRGDRGLPVTTIALVQQHLADLAADDAVVMLGPDSELGWAASLRRGDLARAVIDDWREQCGAVVVEVYSHRARGRGPGAGPHAAWIAGEGRAAGVDVVLTNAVRYAERVDAITADVLDAAHRLVPLDPRHLDRPNAEGCLKPGPAMVDVAEEICRLAGLGRSAAARLLDRTRALAERCALDPHTGLGLGEVHLPDFPVGQPDGDRLLRHRCEAALHGRFGPGQQTSASIRLEAELAVIAQLGFAPYFLTVADVVDLIRGMGVRVAARGSGAGSLVNYLLAISGVDPLRHGLLMERFLSPLRRTLPDIDIDVESARRTEVYERILDRYTADRCACVSMMDTYRVRHAVHDVGVALGMPVGEVDSIAKAFPHIRARDARDALRDLPELRATGLGEQRLDLLFGLVERLDGLPRHIALHPCAVLLSDQALLDRTPVEASLLGFPMSQFDKDDVEALGLLKLDVLGIRMQSAMAHAVDEVARVDRCRIDLDDERQVPRDDEPTFDLIRSARTLGCFQIESPGQRELIARFGPETFDDLVIDISLFRPGPVKSDMVNPFLRARQGWSMPDYLHERLEPILRPTKGVVVFHEQVIELIAALSGCSFAAADEIRRRLGDRAQRDVVRAWFFRSVAGQGIARSLATKCWAVLEAFASFGFCKAHAAAFALPTYQSAWLKAHHPAAFLAGVLTHDPGMYPKRLILDDARRFGIAVLPLDVDVSTDVYRVERVPGGHGIRIALSDVKGISAAEVARIVATRPFGSLSDLWHRARPSRVVAERIVLAGGLDALYGIGSPVTVRRRGSVTRRDLLLQVSELDRRTKAIDPNGAVQLAFDLDDDARAGEASGLPEMTGAERVRAELDILGLDISHHVVDFYAPMLAELQVVRARDLLAQRSGSELLVAGVKVATQTPPMRSGRRVVFVTVDDGSGPVDATFFDDVQSSYALTIFRSWLLVIRGDLRRTGRRGVSLRASGCWDLTALYDRWQRKGITAVRECFEAEPGAPTTPPVRRSLTYRSPGSPG